MNSAAIKYSTLAAALIHGLHLVVFHSVHAAMLRSPKFYNTKEYNFLSNADDQQKQQQEHRQHNSYNANMITKNPYTKTYIDRSNNNNNGSNYNNKSAGSGNWNSNYNAYNSYSNQHQNASTGSYNSMYYNSNTAAQQGSNYNNPYSGTSSTYNPYAAQNDDNNADDSSRANHATSFFSSFRHNTVKTDSGTSETNNEHRIMTYIVICLVSLSIVTLVLGLMFDCAGTNEPKQVTTYSSKSKTTSSDKKKKRGKKSSRSSSSSRRRMDKDDDDSLEDSLQSNEH